MRIKNLNLQTTLWSAQLTIECDMKEAAELQRIIDEAGKVDSEAEYTVSIKRRKKKRSLDANAYMWVLLKELAFKVENSPIELYKYYVRGIRSILRNPRARGRIRGLLEGVEQSRYSMVRR